MNNLLHLKGIFSQLKNKSKPSTANLPTGKSISSAKLNNLLVNLIDLYSYWEKEEFILGALITVHYIKIAAKSNRVKTLLSKGSLGANDSIVGARFSKDKSPRHIITHYISLETLKKSINNLEKCINILNTLYNNKISYDDIKSIESKKINFKKYDIAKTNFINIIVDSYYVDKFDILIDDVSFSNDSIISLYKTDIDTQEILKKIGINIISPRIIDETTILLRPDELDLLKHKAPYLISMAVSDLSKITKDDFDFQDESCILNIPSPKNEPTIGVIDTLFNEEVYFSDWVEYHDMVPKEIKRTSSDYEHGTAVSSIIVDGPAFNPKLDDGCGRFKVRHFGVASGKSFNSFSILRSISNIISSNKDIKVWNLSLGSKLEIHPNFISPEAAILDKIQYENDVIFVIAGTNLSGGETQVRGLGAPADSINSIVVNSVDQNKNPATYSRKGPVLSFFIKPDVSYYGGCNKNPINVCTPLGEARVKGTSFAAPWISRKLSYLIDILGLSREIAKTLLINSATSWEEEKNEVELVGHGVVPIKIEEVVKCSDDEIQFVIQGKSIEYDTYNYNLPIPKIIENNLEKHPFLVKATLCYFPACSRNQGVDYTNTELDITFGRLNDKGELKSINNNYQMDKSQKYPTWEKDARDLFRKWDNVKHIREVYSGKNRSKKSYSSGLWGISLKTKERLSKKFGKNLKFGIVVTLKEINGINRIDEFIKNVQSRGWLVNTIDIDTRVEIFNISEEEIELK